MQAPTSRCSSLQQVPLVRGGTARPPPPDTAVPFIIIIIMYHTSSEEPGLRPRRGDTLNSRPPSISHRTIPMRAAQISSAIHSVFEARQLITTGRARLRPILPAPTSNRISREQPPHPPPPPPPPPGRRLLQRQQVSEPSSSNNTSNISFPFVMLETEEGSENNNNNNDMRIQAGAVSSLGERNSSRNRNPTDADWNQYRTIITRLYWDENLSMPVVREYMKREHGFDATYVQSFLLPSYFCHGWLAAWLPTLAHSSSGCVVIRKPGPQISTKQ